MLMSLGIPLISMNASSGINHSSLYFQNLIFGAGYSFLNVEQNEGMFEMGISNEKISPSGWS